MIFNRVLKMLTDLLLLAHDILAPRDELVAEVLPLALAHEWILFGWSVSVFPFDVHA